MNGMYSIIWIAGTPGVGKTTIGRALARRLGYRFIDLPEYVKRRRLYISYDRAWKTYVVDPSKLRKALEKDVPENCIISSHIILPKTGFRVKCIVLRVNPLKLFIRLRRRGYSLRKAGENVEAEFLGTVYVEAVKAFGSRNVFQIDITGKKREQILAKCINFVKGVSVTESVDWMASLHEKDVDKLLSLLARTRFGKS